VTEISGYYQVPEDQQAAGTVLVDEELIDFFTGQSLVDPDDNSILVSDSQKTVVPSTNAIPIILRNSSAISATVVNDKVSEVEYSLLGIPRAETALGLWGAVNTYGIDFNFWTIKPGGLALYKYFADPLDWTFRVINGIQYGWFTRHLPNEAALQVYALPPPQSFTFPFDDGTGRFPGGKTDGVIEHYIESKRSFRYQPGRITGFTMGVKMSTGSNRDGESVWWGARNDDGDGYYFRLDRGTDLYIVRSSPDLPFLEVHRDDWNGDPVSVDRGTTAWNLDLSKVTMFRIEFGWYGAIGASFFAYVPIDHDNARWVKLHSIRAENTNIVPSLHNPYLRMFIQAKQTAGAESPAFINLYGSSVYIDGGDDGTLEPGSIGSPDVTITNQPIAFLGIQAANNINGVKNQKAILPSTLSLSSNCSAKVDLVLQDPGIGNSESYNFGYGSTLTANSGTAIPVVRTLDPATISGAFPSGTLFSPAPFHGYFYSGYPVKLVASGVYTAFATSYSTTSITANRSLPSISGVIIASFNNHAVASGVTITSGDGVQYGAIRQYTGKLFHRRLLGSAEGNYWRLGLWLNASGTYQPGVSSVYWLSVSYPGMNYTISGTITTEIGEISLPYEVYRQTAFSIVESGGNTQIKGFTFRPVLPAPPVKNYAGSVFPIGIVAELYPGANVSDVMLSMAPMEEGLLGLDGQSFSDAYDNAVVIPGSGRTVAITNWVTSGITVSTVGLSGYVANKFETSVSRAVAGTLVDTAGRRTLYPGGNVVASFFMASGETASHQLSPYFGSDKLFLTGGSNTQYSTGALFVVASTRGTGESGTINASLSWSEQ